MCNKNINNIPNVYIKKEISKNKGKNRRRELEKEKVITRFGKKVIFDRYEEIIYKKLKQYK